MKNRRYQILSFEQQLNAKYWDWTVEKLKLFDDYQSHKKAIFQEIYNRISENFELEVIALNIHDMDISEMHPDTFVAPHVHGVVKFKVKRSISQLAEVLGIGAEFIKKTERHRYNFENLMAYLIHAKNPDKHMYSPENVETFGTFDYLSYFQSKEKQWKEYKATCKREDSKLSLAYTLDQIYNGTLSYRDLMLDDNLAYIFANHQQEIRDRFTFRGERTAFLRLEDLRLNKYKMTVIYVEGRPGVGKTYFARELAQTIKNYGIANGYDSDIFSASSSNPFNDYFGEDILILDDLRPQSISSSDWLKLFDPLNEAKMSARYKNRLIVPRVIIMTNYKKTEDFFSELIGEDVNQFIRRVNFSAEILKEKEGGELYGKYYHLSESKELAIPKQKRISEDEVLTLEYDFESLYSNNDKDNFINQLLNYYVYPRIYPKTEQDFAFLNEKITRID